MKKRLFAAIIVLVLSFSFLNTGCAESESYSFDALLLPSMDIFDTAGTAIQSSNRSFAAACMYIEYALNQQNSGVDVDNRAVWNDCVITRNNSEIAVAFDVENGILILFYSTISKEINVLDFPNVPFSFASQALEATGATSIYTIEGEDWTDMMQQLLLAVQK